MKTKILKHRVPLLYGNSHFNMQLTLNAVNQAFAQSPYLSNKQ